MLPVRKIVCMSIEYWGNDADRWKMWSSEKNLLPWQSATNPAWTVLGL